MDAVESDCLQAVDNGDVVDFDLDTIVVFDEQDLDVLISLDAVDDVEGTDLHGPKVNGLDEQDMAGLDSVVDLEDMS